MPYKRLIVERNAFLVWFGVIGLVLWFAFIRAEGVKTLDDITRTLINEGHSLFWIAAPFLLCTYSIVVGLGLRWWRDLRVDRVGRRIKTDRGDVIAFDRIGALSITNAGLIAEGVARPLYRRHGAEVRRDALEHALGRGGRAHLHQLRRLAVQRSPQLFIGALIATAALTFIVINNIVYRGSDELEYKLMALVGYALCFMAFRRALFGSFAADQPYVDPIAGVLRLADGTMKRFDEIREIEPRWPNAQREALKVALLQHQLRRVLEMPAVEGDAFRAGLDPEHEIERIASDPHYRSAAIAALTHDPDPTIRERAKQLL